MRTVARVEGGLADVGWTGEYMRRRPVTWFFCISLAINVAVKGLFLASGAAEVFEAAMEATGLTGRTDFVSAFRLALEAPRAIPGIALSILQPLSRRRSSSGRSASGGWCAATGFGAAPSGGKGDSGRGP